MRIPALIMAGGKGQRIGLPIEKPLLPFLNKPLIAWVIGAVTSAKNVSEFYVVTSDNTPHTEAFCKRKGWKFLHTDAKGYHNDLKQATKMAGLLGPVLTVPADSPALTGSFLDKVVDQFAVCGEDFLAVFVPIENREKLELSIDSTDEYKGIWYAVSGINIVNGQAIQGEGKIKTSAIISRDEEVILNINTQKDLQIAEEIVLSHKMK